jgi:hypothetical protein
MDDGRLWSDYIYAETAEDYKISEKISEVKVVTQDDLTNLRISLEEKIKKDLQSELYFRYPQSYPIFDEYLISFKISNISHSLGEKTDKLSGLVEGKLETYVLNKKEVEDLAKNIVFKSLGEDKINSLSKISKSFLLIFLILILKRNYESFNESESLFKT